MLTLLICRPVLRRDQEQGADFGRGQHQRDLVDPGRWAGRTRTPGNHVLPLVT